MSLKLSWNRRRLLAEGAYGLTEPCPHDHPDGALELLTPVVRESYRVGGRARSRVAWRPARPILACCARDVEDPAGRVGFWQTLVVREGYADRLAWLRTELAKVVAPLTLDERELVEACPEVAFPPCLVGAATPEEFREFHQRALRDARRERDAWRAGRRSGEPYLAWRAREAVEEPERDRKWAPPHQPLLRLVRGGRPRAAPEQDSPDGERRGALSVV